MFRYAYLYLGDALASSSSETYNGVLVVRDPRGVDCGALALRLDGLTLLRRCRDLAGNASQVPVCGNIFHVPARLSSIKITSIWSQLRLIGQSFRCIGARRPCPSAVPKTLLDRPIRCTMYKLSSHNFRSIFDLFNQ
ncbi:unnamed protein product [Danaus chrysippus]|uniref:(African queen) hypothetical protein n=1 Tax=Danaus chrysippus TaxID=151541 RepID=A0A8J2R3M3_9NEOP|nr:unnamed protein product [Danaus chrysippus]